MRLFTVIVLLLLFFFSGMTYGLFESTKSQNNNVIDEQVVDEKTVEEELEELETIVKLPETEPSFIHACAQFLERIITFFYELFIKFLYYIASLFFK